MEPNFWKLSQGAEQFGFDDIISSINEGFVYVHKNTSAKGRSSVSQAEYFINAEIGDYFYLTHGNFGIYLLGQFSGPANIFSQYGQGWVARPFELVFPSQNSEAYTGPIKWWAPNENSTFVRVPKEEVKEFENNILWPYFGVSLKDFGL